MPIVRNYSAGSIVYFAGDVGEEVYVMQKGRISLISTSLDQKEDIKEDVRKAEFFGVKSSLGRYPREETAQVLMDSQVLVFKQAEFEQFAQKNTRIVLQMLKVFSSQLRRVHKAVREFLGEHGTSESSLELVGVGEYYYKAGKNDYALYAFDAYLKHFPGGALSERVRSLNQMIKQGAPFPLNLTPLAEEMQKHEVATRTSSMMQRVQHDDSMADYSSDMPNQNFDAATPATDHLDLPPAHDLELPTDMDMAMPDMDFDAPAHGGKSVADHYQEGVNAFAAHNFDEAISAYGEGLSLITGGVHDNDHHEKILFELGRSYSKKGNAKAAVEKFSELIKLFPQSGLMKKTMILLGEIYERAKDVNRAASFFERASKIPPQDKEANLAAQKAHSLRGQK